MPLPPSFQRPSSQKQRKFPEKGFWLRLMSSNSSSGGTSIGEEAAWRAIDIAVFSSFCCRNSNEGEEDRTRPRSHRPSLRLRNYDDINEYFLRHRCFGRLQWPMELNSNFFTIGKTGFVEKSSFWNAAIITAWDETTYPWEALARRDVEVRVLTIFITWAVLRVLRSVLDGGTQYSLVSRETAWLGVRMLLKTITAMGWSVVFSVLYSSIWSKKWG
ncbi:hypothetical protein MRB53_005018 [Persea americana]|uniref:Uncharacterized protein n=1 Tax=Persea americana TaxID=3435 RepID=A0ACC2MC65_PERAE|nr:hypothetical protein MRB53_005018 [Persea americana]